ncbi:MAG: HNH endonuclease [Actinomycetota bacterium]|nr:HNH endonuclease [Actinomycetota bacterium]
MLDGASLASLVCHSTMHRVLMAGPVLLDYGTATKTISANLYNAVVVRDRHCRFPGCDRPAAWADVHHVVHAEDGGPTCASNCVLLCRRHHSRLHRKGWSAELKPDGELVVHNPDGREFSSHPPASRPRPPPELLSAA